MLKPTIHVDEFASKMGDDDDIIVVSFFVRSQQAAEDLMNWFEKATNGYWMLIVAQVKSCLVDFLFTLKCVDVAQPGPKLLKPSAI